VHDNTSLENRLFAAELTEACAKALGIRNRGVKSETESARKRLGILHTVPRVVLLEVCFLNQHDLGKFDAAMKTRHLPDQLAKILKTAAR
jgi:N-acetylmuramoyl-L-alanine amidase